MFRLLALLACCQILEAPTARDDDVPLPPPPSPPSPPSPPRDSFILDDDEDDDDLRRTLFQAMELDDRDEDKSDDDDDAGCDDEACASDSPLKPCRPWQAWRKLPVQSKKAMSEDYNHKVWVVEPDGPHHSLLTCLHNGQQFKVCNNRRKKALQQLDPNVIARTCLQSRACSAHCKHNCWTRFSVGEVLLHRSRTASCQTEGEINETLAQFLRQYNHNAAKGTHLRYVVNGKEVCPDFYATVEGISGNKL